MNDGYEFVGLIELSNSSNVFIQYLPVYKKGNVLYSHSVHRGTGKIDSYNSLSNVRNFINIQDVKFDHFLNGFDIAELAKFVFKYENITYLTNYLDASVFFSNLLTQRKEKEHILANPFGKINFIEMACYSRQIDLLDEAKSIARDFFGDYNYFPQLHAQEIESTQFEQIFDLTELIAKKTRINVSNFIRKKDERTYISNLWIETVKITVNARENHQYKDLDQTESKEMANDIMKVLEEAELENA